MTGRRPRRKRALEDPQLQAHPGLRHAQPGRALFDVFGGLLVFNLDDPARPFAQAFFDMSTFPTGQILLDRRRILIPSFQFGIYVFDLDEFNLPPPPE